MPASLAHPSTGSSTAPPALTHGTHNYLTLTLPSSFSSSSAFAANDLPDGVRHLGHVGELRDVQLFEVPKDRGEETLKEVEDVLRRLGGEGSRVEREVPRLRAKRGGDEL